MPGETNLEKLISDMKPTLNEGLYVFTSVTNLKEIPLEQVFASLIEEEGMSLILRKEDADSLGLAYEYIAAWITLKVHSALKAIGFTAAFSGELARNGISCNIVAGYYHDHIFVEAKDADQAFRILKNMGRKRPDKLENEKN